MAPSALYPLRYDPFVVVSKKLVDVGPGQIATEMAAVEHRVVERMTLFAIGWRWFGTLQVNLRLLLDGLRAW